MELTDPGDFPRSITQLEDYLQARYKNHEVAREGDGLLFYISDRRPPAEITIEPYHFGDHFEGYQVWVNLPPDAIDHIPVDDPYLLESIAEILDDTIKEEIERD
jgi:hypothetical protein